MYKSTDIGEHHYWHAARRSVYNGVIAGLKFFFQRSSENRIAVEDCIYKARYPSSTALGCA